MMTSFWIDETRTYAVEAADRAAAIEIWQKDKDKYYLCQSFATTELEDVDIGLKIEIDEDQQRQIMEMKP